MKTEIKSINGSELSIKQRIEILKDNGQEINSLRYLGVLIDNGKKPYKTGYKVFLSDKGDIAKGGIFISKTLATEYKIGKLIGDDIEDPIIELNQAQMCAINLIIKTEFPNIKSFAVSTDNLPKSEYDKFYGKSK